MSFSNEVFAVRLYAQEKHSYCSQWGWPELQREPKQLLQPVLALASVLMRNGCDVSFHNSTNQDALMPSTDTPLQKNKKKTKQEQHILIAPRLIIMRLASGHPNLSAVSSRMAALPRVGEEPKLMDMETDGGVTVQRKHDDDPDILEKPRGATVFTHSSTTDDRSWRYDWLCCVRAASLRLFL